MSIDVAEKSNGIDETNKLEAALNAAETFTVYWCPRCQPLGSIRTSKKFAVYTTENVIKACAQLAEEKPTRQLASEIRNVLETGKLSQVANPMKRRSQQSVAMIDELFPQRNWQKLIGDPQSTAIAFGLWERIDPPSAKNTSATQPRPTTDLEWNIEPTVQKTYVKRGGAANVLQEIRRVGQAMAQDAVYLITNNQRTGKQAWLIESATGHICEMGSAVTWYLRTSCDAKWYQQFLALRRALLAVASPNAKALNRLILNKAAKKGIGATFVPKRSPVRDEAVLEVINNGGASFLFTPYFLNEMNKPPSKNHAQTLAEMFALDLAQAAHQKIVNQQTVPVKKGARKPAKVLNLGFHGSPVRDVVYKISQAHPRAAQKCPSLNAPKKGPHPTLFPKKPPSGFIVKDFFHA